MNAIHPTDYPLHKIINIRQVIGCTGLSRSTIYEIINPKSKYYDETFPKQVNLTTSRVGWLASEINDWIESKIARR